MLASPPALSRAFVTLPPTCGGLRGDPLADPPLLLRRPLPMNVFTYGSLMFDPVWHSVVSGRGHRSTAASLAGYRRFAVLGETYPGVIAWPGGRVDGRLYLDVDPADVARLDAFEGADYDRVTVTVQAPGEVPPAVAAGLYLYLPTDRLAPDDWDVEAFAREGIHRFMTTYCPTPRGSG